MSKMDDVLNTGRLSQIFGYIETGSYNFLVLDDWAGLADNGLNDIGIVAMLSERQERLLLDIEDFVSSAPKDAADRVYLFYGNPIEAKLEMIDCLMIFLDLSFLGKHKDYGITLKLYLDHLFDNKKISFFEKEATMLAVEAWYRLPSHCKKFLKKVNELSIIDVKLLPKRKK